MKITTKSTLTTIFACTAALTFASPATAKVVTGEAAPDVRVLDSNGAERSLSEFKGQDVVLEWTNHKCPYVVKHYGRLRPVSKGMYRVRKRMSSVHRVGQRLQLFFLTKLAMRVVYTRRKQHRTCISSTKKARLYIRAPSTVFRVQTRRKFRKR